MAWLFWDASALAKRYAPEVGSETVDALFESASVERMVSTLWVYAETVAVLVRKLNSGRLDQPTYTASMTSLQEEVIDSQEFAFLTVDDPAVLAGISLIQRHNLNAADAIFLSVLLRFSQRRPSDDSPLILVTADQRLLRTAQAEGVATLNPETLSAGDVDRYFTTL